jgi:hypothetical protein
MVTMRALAAAAILVVASAREARAEGDPLSPPRVTADVGSYVHHAPISSAKAHEELRILAALDHPEQIRNAVVVYSGKASEGELKVAPLLRSQSPDEAYVAVIPAADVTAPGLGYAIEIERTDGGRIAAFGSRADLQPVLVIEDHMDVREQAAWKRLGSRPRRSVVAVSGDYVRFGTTTGAPIPCAAGQTACVQGQPFTPSVVDQFWRVETGYTYRWLRTVAEFGIKIGVVRGTSLVALPEYDIKKYSVGLNYAEPWLRFRIADAWHLELAALTSVTEIGFSVGGGLALLIGDPYGTRLTLGAEEIGFQQTYFGSRFYTKVDILVREGITVAPVVEVTDMPHADSFGVRLYGDASIALPRGFGIGLRGGYQARRSTSGGPSGGGTLWYSF